VSFLLVATAIYIRLGLVPFITTAAFAATGSIGYALIYPIVVPTVCFVLGVADAEDPQDRHLAADRG